MDWDNIDLETGAVRRMSRYWLVATSTPTIKVAKWTIQQVMLP